jgi:hypothetical protein
MDATSGAWTDYPSGAHEFTPIFSGVRVTRYLALCELNPWFSSFLVSSNPLTMKSRQEPQALEYQLRDIYPICRCCCNAATYKWKVHNGKIEIIGLLLTRKLLNQGLSWSHPFKRFTVATVTWLPVMEYLCHKWPLKRTHNYLQSIHIKLNIE